MPENSPPASVTLIYMQDHPAVEFAVRELGRYLERMSPECRVEARKENVFTQDSGRFVRLGLFEEFGIPLSGLEDPLLDDAVSIDVTGLRGIIAGSNPRSVLLAAYRFLEEAGCRWVRPGRDGEHIPVIEPDSVSVRVSERASYRHRGLCIEGAVSYENMLENIEWAPKAGFNAYFLEFKTPHTFFDRWYSHRHNKYKDPEPVDPRQVDAFTAELEREINKRGLLYHAVGHGWTGEPLGLPCLGWDPVDYTVEEQKSRLFAMVGGKRELWHGVPLNTNLCYSNPEARKLIVQYAADHAEHNRHIDMLHFWLADAFNNHCECDDCVKMLPSDYYVMLLNELDEELAARGLDTKVVFLLYLDLLWVPETETLRNPDRFLLLFAPISRTYSRTYEADTTGIALQPYVRNRLKFPTNIRENVAFLKEWQKLFHGDGFAYEYHHMWDHYYDPGYFQMAEIISEDVKHLRKLGLNGMISDQTQRSFFPTGLGMYVLGKTLWNDASPFRELAEQYFRAAFGEEGKACMAYMEKLSGLFDPPYLRGEKPRVSSEASAKLRCVPDVVRDFRPVIERNVRSSSDACRQKSWEYVQDHADIALMLAGAFEARAEGDMAEARRRWEALSDQVQRDEDRYQPVFDVFLFIQTLQKEFQNEIKTHFGGEVT